MSMCKECKEVEAIVHELCLPCMDNRFEGQKCDIYRLYSALRKVALGQGRYSRDTLTHASNTIDDMKELAQRQIDRFKGSEYETRYDSEDS